MQNLNIIDFTYIVDLSLLDFIEYCDSIEHNLNLSATSNNNSMQLFLDLSSKKHKDILFFYIIEHLIQAYSYNKQNIILNTCRPQLNWRQSDYQNGNLKSYRYLLNDNSIYIDLILLNQFLEQSFKKLQNVKITDLKFNNIVKVSEINKFLAYKNKLIFLDFENIDTYDALYILKYIYSNLVNISFISSTCNIIKDGNSMYLHNAKINENILEIAKLKLTSLNIL